MYLKLAACKRLLFISSELTLGGAAYLTIRWIKALNNHFHITLLICGPIEQRMMDELPPEIKIYQLEPSIWIKTSERLGKLTLDNFSSFLKNKNINILDEDYVAVIGTSIFWSWAACASYYLAKSTHKISFILDEGLLKIRVEKYRQNTIIDLALLVTHNFIAVSADLWSRVSSFKEFESERLAAVMMPPCAEFESVGHKNSNALNIYKPMVLTVARLDPIKRILESLYWHHELKNEGVDFCWYIVGDGIQENFLRQEIKRLGMADDFILVGFDRHIDWWLRQCDIFALFSQSEGCPTVVLEALQARILVICTNVNGVSELIENGKTGLIVSHEPEEIKKQLKSLIMDKLLRESYQKKLLSISLKNNFSSDVIKMRGMINDQSLPAKHTVTILIPTFNQASMLERAINSALYQDYPNLKVVVMDDASTDETNAVCQKWITNPRFQYVRHEQNVGRVDNYQLGLTRYAKGDWVLMLDGDDYLIDSCFISSALEVLIQYPSKEIGFIQAGHRVTHLNEMKADKDIFPDIEGKFQLFEPGRYIPFILKTGFFSHLGLLFNRKMAIKTNAYNNNISSTDMDSFMRLSLSMPVIVFKHIAGVWVQHGTNASSQVHVDDIYKNLKIFRLHSVNASLNGLISAHEWRKSLLRFEAKNLTFLFTRALGTSVKRPFDVFKIFPIAWKLHPCLILHPRIIKTLYKSFFKLLTFTKV